MHNQLPSNLDMDEFTSLVCSTNVAGIDAGASLWKLFCAGKNAEMELLPSGSIEHVQHQVARWAPSAVGITGAKAGVVAAALSSVQTLPVNEFAAWGVGASELARLGDIVLPQHHLLVSIGTGTFILEIKGNKATRISGSTLGGGTLLGLSSLIGCSGFFSDLVALASRGERSGVDLLVSDIVPCADNLLTLKDTVASFAKLDSRDRADLAHALIWLIGENIGILCNAIARPLGIQTIVFGGGTLAENDILHRVLRETLKDRGNDALFLPKGAFCGAVGAALFVNV
jgi:type II pantothenate kinase